MTDVTTTCCVCDAARRTLNDESIDWRDVESVEDACATVWMMGAVLARACAEHQSSIEDMMCTRHRTLYTSSRTFMQSALHVATVTLQQRKGDA